jgi:hypothetical protein
LCFPVGDGVNPKRDLSVFNNLAGMGMFITMGLILLTIGAVLLTASWFLTGGEPEDLLQDVWHPAASPNTTLHRERRAGTTDWAPEVGILIVGSAPDPVSGPGRFLEAFRRSGSVR